MPEDVLNRIANGDQAAVKDCLSQYGGLVWSIARRMVEDADVDDAVQEIFVDVWRNAERFDPERASETTFITMIARRRLIDRRRKMQRRPTPQMLPEGLASRHSSGLESVELKDEAAVAKEALAELSDDKRQVLELAIFHGLSHDEISQKTNIPLGTVKTHIRRGLMRVRELLQAGQRKQMAQTNTPNETNASLHSPSNGQGGIR